MVSDIPPIFDPSSRTLKIRLETENPGFILRPDMFVDVDLPVSLPSAVVLPAQAVVYSGERKMVFISKGNGLFEPRMIETGWHFGDEVEVVKGLEPGELVVISGNFLVDSESRLRAAAAGVFGTAVKDPVCNMHVDKEKTEAVGRTSIYLGKTYYFCSDKCKHDFELTPQHYLDAEGGNHTRKIGPVDSSQGRELGKVSIDRICGMKVDEKAAREAGHVSWYNGKEYYFCSEECKVKFENAAQKLAKKRLNAAGAPNGAPNKETRDVHHP